MDDETPKEIDECEDVDLETSSVNKALQSLSSQQSGIDKAKAAMASPSALDRAVQSFSLQQSAIDKAMAAMVRPSALDRAVQTFSLQQSAIDKAMAAMASPSDLDRAVQSFSLQQSGIDKAKAAMVSPSALDRAVQSFSLQQSAIDKAKAAMVRPSALDRAVQTFSLQQSAIDKAMAAMASPSDLDRAVQSFSLQQSAIDRAMATMARPSAIDKALQSFFSQQSAIDKAMAAMAGSSILEHAIKGFATASSVILTDPSYLSEMAQALSAVDFESINISSIEGELENAGSAFRSVEDGKNFLSVFSNLSPLIQAILFYFLIHVFLPQVNSISANLITPVVESYLEASEETDRQKTKGIKNIPLAFKDIDTTDLRFITGDNVRLRAGPSSNSEIYDELTLGQVVTVLAKKRNWIEVMYEYEDGESMSGWVFTRYTAKFVK